MPALDACHPHVVNALVKDGWSIDRNPYHLLIGRRSIFIDLEVSNQQVNQQILLIEVKCFPARESTTRDLYTALGQYLIYRAMLAQANMPFPLYISIPVDVFTVVFDASVLKAVADNRIQLVIVDLDSEVVTQWIR